MKKAMRLSDRYCYNAYCSVRTKEKPWPRSDAVYKYVNVVSRQGNAYRRKMLVCVHCGGEMSKVASMCSETE